MAINRAGSHRVVGLNELRRELKRLDDEDSTEWRKELARVNHDVAEFVVSKARPAMVGLGGMGARAAATLSASRSGVASRLSLGGPKAPFAEGVEFGAISGVPRRTARGTVEGWNQFKAWRGSGSDAGYALFPAMRDNEDQIIEMYGDAVDRLMARAFPD